MIENEDIQDVDDAEICQILECIYLQYGYDFRNYAYDSIRRRILRLNKHSGCMNLSALKEKIISEPLFFDQLLLGLTVHSTSMFRDPGVYKTFRESIIPHLRTYPFVRIWIAGCSTGEEVYSLAILLAEEGLSRKCRIYATDICEPVLVKAKRGIFPLISMKEYTENYIKSGGKKSFSDYYTTDHQCAVLSSNLRDNIAFATHNLVSEKSFNEFHVVLCRNVMIYFNHELQMEVLKTIRNSLVGLGFLVIGHNETLKRTLYEKDFKELCKDKKIYRKIS